MLLYHKKYDKSIKLLKKTTVYLNSLEVCNIIPIYLLYVTQCLQKCVSISFLKKWFGKNDTFKMVCSINIAINMLNKSFMFKYFVFIYAFYLLLFYIIFIWFGFIILYLILFFYHLVLVLSFCI